jgi:CBS domain-containing protein
MLTPLRSLEQLMPFPTAGELLAAKGQPISVFPDTTARAALRAMVEKDIAFLPVIESGLHDERVTLLFPDPGSY